MKFLVLCTTTVDLISKRIQSKSYIAKPDGQIIQVKEKYLQRLLYRYFVKVNTYLKYGSFCIENETGELMLKINSMKLPSSFSVPNNGINELKLVNFQQQTSSDPMSQILKELHYISHYSIGFHIYRLMHMINKLSYKVFPYLEQKLQGQYRKISAETDDCLQNIHSIIKDKISTQIDENEIKKYKYFTLQKPQNDIKILSEIELVDNTIIEKLDQLNQQEQFIGLGGFSTIFKTEVSYKLVSTKINNELKRTLAVKRDSKKEDNKDLNAPRISHEIKILSILSSPPKNQGSEKFGTNYTGYCPFIAQSYYSKQDFCKDIYFLEYYQHTSLDRFRTKFEQTQGLNTKLYILSQIAQGMRYLNQYGVYHLDLKPGNILINKLYVVKITDFGESLYKDDPQLIGGWARTLPFQAPESTWKSDLTNKEVSDLMLKLESPDVFSFGILMYEYIFDQFPIDYKKSNQQELLNKYSNKTYQIRSNVDFIKSLGPKHLMKSLRNLALKCLDKDPTKRPKWEWIIIVLRESLKYLEMMY